MSIGGKYARNGVLTFDKKGRKFIVFSKVTLKYKSFKNY